MDLTILQSDVPGVKWAKLQRIMREAVDNAGITYTLEGMLTDINESDVEGVKWAKLGAWSRLLAENIGGGGGGPAAAGTLTGDTLAANVVNSSLTTFGAGIGVLKVATVTLTDAQIKALPTTPVQVVAAPGVGKIAVPIMALVGLAWTADYTNISADSTFDFFWLPAGAQPFNSLFEADTSSVSSLLAGGGNAYAMSSPLQLGWTAAAPGLSVPRATGDFMGGTNVVDANISVFITNSGDLTGGNAANSLKVTVWYTEADA